MAFFRAVLEDPKIWRSLIKAASGVTDQVVFHATPTGLKVVCMDAIRIMMIRMDLPASSFAEYECKEDVDLAFSLEDMDKILKRTQAKDTLTVRTDEAGKDRKLQVIFKGSADRTFALPLLNMKYEDPPPPKSELSTSIRLTSEALGIAVKDAAAIPGADQIKLATEDGVVIMSAVGDTGYMRNEFRKGSESLLNLESKENASAYYSTEYLGDAMKAQSLHDTVLLQYATDLPMKITFQLETGGEVVYFLAPRRQSESLTDEDHPHCDA